MQNLVALAKELGFKNIEAEEDGVKCSCPFAQWKHKKGTDSKPSFSIYSPEPDVYVYNCFSCKSSGTVQDLITSLFERTGNRKILNYLVDFKYIKPKNDFFFKEKETIKLNQIVYDNLCPSVDEYKLAIDYLESRGISLNTAKRLDLRWHPEHKRIMFKVYNYQGELVGFSGRSTRKDDPVKIRETGGLPKNHLFLGIHKLVKDKPIVLVEGLFAYARLHEYGFDKDYNILACLCSKISKQKRDILIGTGLPLYLFFDNDEAGLIGMFGNNGKIKGACAELCDYIKVFRVHYPDNIVDPDDLSNLQIESMLKNASLVYNARTAKKLEQPKKNQNKKRKSAEDKYNLMFADKK